MTATIPTIDINKIQRFMDANPDVNPPCQALNCPLYPTFQQDSRWMPVPWSKDQVNPYCMDSNCPWYDEAMK